MKKTVVFVFPAVLVVLALTASAQAMVITPLGAEIDLGAGYRSSSVAKNPAYDLNHNNVYGDDGYYVDGWASTATPPYLYGGESNVLSVTPGYISKIEFWGEPSYHDQRPNGVGYAVVNDPTIAPGSTVADLSATGQWYSDSSSQSGFFNLYFGTDAHFVLGVITDVDNNSAAYKGETVQVWKWGDWGSAVGVSCNSANTTPDYAFFDVNVKAGDVISVGGTPLNGGTRIEMHGITFDPYATPEPGTLVLLATGLIGLLCYAWRKRR